MSLRNRLGVNDDYIATELDSAIYGYSGWLSDRQTALGHPPRDEALPEDLQNRLLAATIFVTANLPGRIHELLNAEGLDIPTEGVVAADEEGGGE